MNNDRKGTAQSVRTYRFRDSLALSFVVSDGATGTESVQTIYLPAAMVENMEFVVSDWMSDYVTAKFGPGSTFGTRTIDKEGRRVDE